MKTRQKRKRRQEYPKQCLKLVALHPGIHACFGLGSTARSSGCCEVQQAAAEDAAVFEKAGNGKQLLCVYTLGPTIANSMVL